MRAKYLGQQRERSRPGVIVTKAGQEILVDAKDMEMLLAFVWRVSKCVTSSTGYACTRQSGRRLWMHNLVLPTPPGYTVDHVNGSGLDNRRENLRPATRGQNTANSRRRDNASGFRGVYRARKQGRRPWRAVIRSGGVRRSLGNFPTAEDAARAYNAAAEAVHGPFAALNQLPAKEATT